MSRVEWKPGNMLYPLPAVLVTCRSAEGKDNIMTAAWTGTICSDPVMVSVSVRKSRLTYDYIAETGCFALNLTTEELAFATDYCGVRSGRHEDKFETMHLEKAEAAHISCPLVAASPVSLECKVTQAIDLGSHTMFMATVEAVHVDERFIDDNDRLHLNDAHLLVYSHGEYRKMGGYIGKFGYSVKKGKKTPQSSKKPPQRSEKVSQSRKKPPQHSKKGLQSSSKRSKKSPQNLEKTGQNGKKRTTRAKKH